MASSSVARPAAPARPDDACRAAWEEGRAYGRTLDHQAGACPYHHGEIALRLAWMDGFGSDRPYRPR